jgi:MOSC domain-containing protein YiiM
MPKLISIQVGLPKRHGTEGAADPLERTWTSGFFKAAVAGPVKVGRTNIDGDGQANLKFHGGPDKAILAYSADHYPQWRRELAMPDLPHGGFGENLTIAGIDEESVCIGDTWQIGNEVRVQVSQPRQPCSNINRRWKRKDMTAAVLANGKGGWYLRVMQTGIIEAGMDVRLIERPHPDWTIARANLIMNHQKDDFASAAELAALPELSAAWWEELSERLARAGMPAVPR